MSLMAIKMSFNKKFPILALSGGVGGVKLIQGFTKILSPDQLITIVNTGDDEEFLGLRICPDIDTTIYTLSGISNKKTGWGLEKESWKILKNLEKMGINQWFKIGDNDLVTHLIRTHFLKSGKTLTETTNKIRKLYGLKFKILPMSDEWFKTKLITKNKKMSFQEYFVKEKSQPVITSIIWENNNQKNVLGEELELCSNNPLTGWYRDGCCNTDKNDHGLHTVCAKVTIEFLEWCKEAGNDLITPHPEFGFPGLKDGDGWCVCASWYARAVEAGKGCPIFLKRTHENTLKVLPIETLKKFAIDIS